MSRPASGVGLLWSAGGAATLRAAGRGNRVEVLRHHGSADLDHDYVATLGRGVRDWQLAGDRAFVGTFNDFVLARIMLGLGGTREQWTLMVGMYSFVGSTGEFSTEWGVFAAGSLIAAVPIVILYLVLQRFIVGGLTVGAVKG